MCDYRKVYKDIFGEIPKGCDIHHIDLNRKNNHISNLSAVPRELHKEYHSLVKWFNSEHTLIEHSLCINKDSKYLIDKLIRLNYIKRVIRKGSGW